MIAERMQGQVQSLSFEWPSTKTVLVTKVLAETIDAQRRFRIEKQGEKQPLRERWPVPLGQAEVELRLIVLHDAYSTPPCSPLLLE